MEEGGGWKRRLEDISRVCSRILWKPYHLRYGKYNLMIFLSFSDIHTIICIFSHSLRINQHSIPATFPKSVHVDTEIHS